MNIIVLSFQKTNSVKYRLFEGDVNYLYNALNKIQGEKALEKFLDHASIHPGGQEVFNLYQNEQHFLQVINTNFMLLGQLITANLVHPVLNKRIDYVCLQVSKDWYAFPASEAAEQFKYLVSDSWGLSVKNYAFLKRIEKKYKRLTKRGK
ncbi:hypothetical protein [Lactiplantibacillus plantarum]|uniref:hypothetical protein n=1 Tax=Lactiplantibacillus plantarum TaxID=1590 RepID=UPI001BA917F5|nr:hypothetical protein [Lactiplantibacillus plantarum]MBS0954990.1 hypothetical protein [Lactiplantibacillus plantarum]